MPKFIFRQILPSRPHFFSESMDKILTILFYYINIENLSLVREQKSKAGLIIAMIRSKRRKTGTKSNTRTLEMYFEKYRLVNELSSGYSTEKYIFTTI